jgi:hypothetical protein
MVLGSTLLFCFSIMIQPCLTSQILAGLAGLPGLLGLLPELPGRKKEPAELDV